MLLPCGSVSLLVVLQYLWYLTGAARSLLYCIMRIRESAAYTGYFCYLPWWVKLLVVPGMWLPLQVSQPAPARAQETKGSLLPRQQLMWICMAPWLSRGFGADESMCPAVLVGPLLQKEMVFVFFPTVFWKCSWWALQFWKADLRKRLLSFLKIANQVWI